MGVGQSVPGLAKALPLPQDSDLTVVCLRELFPRDVRFYQAEAAEIIHSTVAGTGDEEGCGDG